MSTYEERKELFPPLPGDMGPSQWVPVEFSTLQSLMTATEARAETEKALVEAWNSTHEESGCAVRVRKDDGSEVETKTRSAAWLLGGHTAVILLEGISGAFMLNRVRLL